MLNVTHEKCKQADSDYYAEKIAYYVAVKYCLQTLMNENSAMKLCNDLHSYVVEGMDGKHLPSACASKIYKLGA